MWNVFFQNPFFSTLIIFLSFFVIFPWSYDLEQLSRHYQFDWVCAAHLKYKTLVLKKLRITGIWIRKNKYWQQNNFRKIKSMQHVLVDLQ